MATDTVSPTVRDQDGRTAAHAHNPGPAVGIMEAMSDAIAYLNRRILEEEGGSPSVFACTEAIAACLTKLDNSLDQLREFVTQLEKAQQQLDHTSPAIAASELGPSQPKRDTADGRPSLPADATVGTHPEEALLLARDASFRLEGMAKVLEREMTQEQQDYARPRLVRDIIKLNSVVMTALAKDDVAKLADLAEIVGEEATHG